MGHAPATRKPRRQQGQDWSGGGERSNTHRQRDVRCSRTWDLPTPKVTLRRKKQVLPSQHITCIYNKPSDSLLGPPAAAVALHSCCDNRLWTRTGHTSLANIGEASSNQRTGCKSHSSLITCTEVRSVPSHFPMTINGQRDPAFKAYAALEPGSPRTALFQTWI